MTNSITATIKFSFKGETFSPSARIDLDAFFAAKPVLEPGVFPQYVYNMIAKNGEIDGYSYAYEVMLASEVVFSEPTGLAGECLQGNKFDFECFQQRWLYQQKLETVQDIALRHLKVEDIEQQPKLRDALLEALEKSI